LESKKRKSSRGPEIQGKKNPNQKSEKNKNPVQKSEQKENPDKMSVFLKRVGDDGTTNEKLNEETFFKLLDQCNNSWCDSETTLVYPLYPDPSQYSGPTGLTNVPQKTNEEREGNVIGFTNEMKVTRALERFSKKNNAGLKIFPGVKITFEKLKGLAHLFGSNIDDLKRFFNYFYLFYIFALHKKLKKKKHFTM